MCLKAERITIFLVIRTLSHQILTNKKLKNMKWIQILIFALICNVGFSQNAQQAKPLTIEERAAQAVDGLHKDLKLSPSQQESIKKIQIKFFKQLDKAKESFMNKKGSDRNKAVKKMQALNNQREKAISKLLNDEQKEIYNKKIAIGKAVKKEVMPSPDEKKMNSNSGN